jgi:hypothetical protein
MYINLRCSKCKESAPTQYDDLYRVWKAGYDRMPEDIKSEMFVTAEIRCLCGHQEKYDTPMFTYTFGVIFQELMSLED